MYFKCLRYGVIYKSRLNHSIGLLELSYNKERMDLWLAVIFAWIMEEILFN